MSLTTKGVIEKIMDTQEISLKFKKREFIINDQGQYPQTISFEFHQDKVSELDKFSEGQEVEVHFNLRGRSWTKEGTTDTRYFNTLQAWKLDLTESELPAPSNDSHPEPVQVEDEFDDMPF